MRYYSSIAQQMSLTGSINSSAISMAVNTVSGLPPSTPFTLVIDPSSPSEEIVTVTEVAGTTLTITRGEDGSAATSHSTGAEVRHLMTARDLREPQQHAAAESDVHGIGSDSSVVGTNTAQTLTEKTLDAAANTFVGLPPVGSILATARSTAPDGWLLCDGSAVSRSTYAALFAAIGTTFGSGNGSTTFNLPDLRGRVIAGIDSSQAEFDARGETGGAKTHTLTSAQMPSHSHTASTSSAGAHTHTGTTNSAGSHTHSGSTTNSGAHNHTGLSVDGFPIRWQENSKDGTGNVSSFVSGGGTNPVIASGSSDHSHPLSINSAGSHSHTVSVGSAGAHTHSVTVNSAGSGQAHNNLQPYMALHHIIKF